MHESRIHWKTMTLEVSIWHLISLFYQMVTSFVLIQCKTFILNSLSGLSSRPGTYGLRESGLAHTIHKKSNSECQKQFFEKFNTNINNQTNFISEFRRKIHRTYYDKCMTALTSTCNFRYKSITLDFYILIARIVDFYIWSYWSMSPIGHYSWGFLEIKFDFGNTMSWHVPDHISCAGNG